MAEEIQAPLNAVDGYPETEIVGNGTASKSEGPRTKSHTRKVVQSVVLYCGFIAIGLTFGVNGPTFLDLEILTGGTTDQVAFTFIGGSISAFLGALCAGAVISKYNPWLLLSLDFIPLAFLQTSIPWARSIPVLALLNVLRGFFTVFYDAGGNVTLLNIWGKDNGPWMQALHFLFGVGGLLGPILAKPFIYVQNEEEANSTELAHNSSTFSNVTGSPRDDPDLSELKVWVAYLVTGIVIMAVCVALFCIYVAGDRKFKQIQKKEQKEKKEEGQFANEKCFKITIVGFVFFLAFSYCVVEMNYINFIVVYLVKHLGLSKPTAASMNAAFWASFTVGRGVGIFVTLILPPQVMLGLSVFGAMAFLSPQPFALMLPEWAMWGLVVGLGLSLSTTFATLITWTERYIKVEGMVGVMFMVAGALGDMAGPITIGILFKRYGPGALMIFLFGVSIVTVCVFCLAQFIAWRHGERERDETDAEIKRTERNEEELLPVTGKGHPEGDVDLT